LGARPLGSPRRRQWACERMTSGQAPEGRVGARVMPDDGNVRGCGSNAGGSTISGFLRNRRWRARPIPAADSCEVAMAGFGGCRRTRCACGGELAAIFWTNVPDFRRSDDPHSDPSPLMMSAALTMVLTACLAFEFFKRIPLDCRMTCAQYQFLNSVFTRDVPDGLYAQASARIGAWFGSSLAGVQRARLMRGLAWLRNR